MDPRQDGSWNSLPAGKPGQTGSLAQSICRSHVMSSLRNHGTDHKAPALRKRHYDLWGRFVLRRVSPGRREHSFSPAAVEFTRVKFRLKGKQRHSCSGLADWSIGGEGNPLRRRRAVRFTIALRSSARDGALCSARMAKLADAADLKSAGAYPPWGFKSPSGHHIINSLHSFSSLLYSTQNRPVILLGILWYDVTQRGVSPCQGEQ